MYGFVTDSVDTDKTERIGSSLHSHIKCHSAYLPSSITWICENAFSICENSFHFQI